MAFNYIHFWLNNFGEEKVFQIEFFDIFNQQLIRKLGWMEWKPVIIFYIAVAANHHCYATVITAAAITTTKCSLVYIWIIGIFVFYRHLAMQHVSDKQLKFKSNFN